jgi:hypothetical protein
LIKAVVVPKLCHFGVKNIDFGFVFLIFLFELGLMDLGYVFLAMFLG